MKNSEFIMVEMEWEGLHRELQCSQLFYFFKENLE